MTSPSCHWLGRARLARCALLGVQQKGMLLKSAAQVFQVQERFHGGRVLAMKVMRKAHVVEKNQAEYMRTERDVLTRVEHPFIVLLHYSFQVGQLAHALSRRPSADAPSLLPMRVL